MNPTVGLIVHFYDHSRPRDASGKPGPHAALVTAAPLLDDHARHVSLTVFPDGYPPVTVASVHIVDAADDGVYWTWPPRE